MNRTTANFETFKIFSTILGGDQLYLSAATQHPEKSELLTERIYAEIAARLARDGFQIIHERIFASLQHHPSIIKARATVMQAHGFSAASPLTFIQGHPVKGRGLAGVQIRAFKPSRAGDSVRTIYEGEIPVGKSWVRNGASFQIVQNMHGSAGSSDHYHESCEMFDRTQRVLQQDGTSFKNVLRTWIYLSNILDWYGEFNRARNARFTEYGILGLSEKENTEAEQIYLPASTGILGENPDGAVSTMDVFAVADARNISIAHTSGVQQKSPYRYGSAFSRAMTLKEADVTHILLSGTASIDEHGKTAHVDDVRQQIRKTFQVVQALIEKEGATLSDINEATVFLKDAQDLQTYWDVAAEFGLLDLPAILLIADVCRADLLFEIDAAVAFE
ncbi:hypothetical protein JXA02_01360 [candidate division KSB1 bacterium]|nr:hypothetical protein [candidate division KSB1 bacterium]RQW10988.1 MAG: hypothetical protein EH222_01470 [candidate division KSB1 bacterium]